MERFTKVDALELKRVLNVIMEDLEISSAEVKFDFSSLADGSKGGCRRISKDLFVVRIALDGHNSLEELYYTAAHELRHVWQIKRRYDLKKKLGHIYLETYDFNVYEMDADRYADYMVYGKKGRKNSLGMYYSRIESFHFSLKLFLADSKEK